MLDDIFLNTGNSECHVIAGAILSPETTLPLAKEITAFVRSTTTIPKQKKAFDADVNVHPEMQEPSP